MPTDWKELGKIQGAAPDNYRVEDLREFLFYNRSPESVAFDLWMALGELLRRRKEDTTYIDRTGREGDTDGYQGEEVRSEVEA